MTPFDKRYLCELRAKFDLATLGEGNPVTGANLLAAMACSIANIARPGSGLKTTDGKILAVGTSLMVSGSHSSNLITERVLSDMGIKQNNILSHIRSREHTIADEATNSKCEFERDTRCLSPLAGGANLKQLYRVGPIDAQDAKHMWTQVIHHPAQSDFRDLLDRHLIYVTGTTAAQVERQLQHSHLGRPFIHLGVDQASDFGRWQHLCPAVMDGRLTAEPISGSVRGTVVVTDPSALLGGAILTDAPSARWALRMPWLVDGDAGPQLDDTAESGDSEQPIALNNMEQRYKSVMNNAWSERINNLTILPVPVSYDYYIGQAQWLAFLKTMESELPGITGGARSLFASLVFGITRMIKVGDVPEGFHWFTNHVEALAQFLINRMANARATMLRSAEDSRKRQIEAAILCKLADGPQSVRDLSRRFNKLPSGSCREMLLDLEAVGRVTRCGSDWKLSATEEAAFITASDTPQPAIAAHA